MDVLTWIVVIGGLCAVVYYYGFTEKGQAEAKKAKAKQEAKADQKLGKQLAAKPGRKVDAPISQVGKAGPGGAGLACPKCGGTQFKARRSGAARAGVVATGLIGAGLTKQTKVTCVTCGTVYGRG